MLSLEKGSKEALRPGLSQVLQSGAETNARYIYHEGALYSCNHQREVELRNKDLPLVDWYELVTIAVHPHDADEFWIALGEKGLYHSTDRGVTIERLENVTLAENIRLTSLTHEGPRDVGLLLTGRLKGGHQGTFYSVNGGVEWVEVR